jgi:hypothetical protein
MWHAWGRGEMFIGLWLGGPKVRERWEDPGLGERINVNMDVEEIRIDGANWIRLAQDKDRWRAFVNTVMNVWVP